MAETRPARVAVDGIALSDGLIRVQVLPEHGGRIVSLQDDGGNEYLAPGRPPEAVLTSETPFEQGGLAGIDDCLPAIAPGRYPDGPFNGTRIPDHGELWFRAADVVAHDGARLVLSMQGLELPFELTRAFEVKGSALRVAYALSNSAQHELPVLWAAHPLFQPTDDLIIDLPGVAWLRREDADDGSQPKVRWPRLTDAASSHRLDRWRDIPRGLFLKAFAPYLAPPSLIYPSRRRRVRIIATADRPLHLGVWINRGGFPSGAPLEHLALEPTFGSCDALPPAIEDRSCLVVPPRGRVEWAIEYVVEPYQVGS